MSSSSMVIGIVFTLISLFFSFWINSEFGWTLPTLSETQTAKDVRDYATILSKNFTVAMVDGKWDILRSIGNITTGENITVEVLTDDSSGIPLIRSSAIIHSPPNAVAEYFKPAPSQAASVARINSWNKHSSGFNLALINRIDKILDIGDGAVLVKQFANAYGAFAVLFWNTRIFHQAQVWMEQQGNMLVKETSVSPNSQFEIPAGTLMFASFSVEYSKPALWGGLSEGESLAVKDSLYWFIPVAGGKVTRIVSVSRQDLGKLVPRALQTVTSGPAHVAVFRELKKLCESNAQQKF